MYVAQRLTKIDDGVYLDEHPQALPDAGEIEDHYERNALKILADDQGHYRGVKQLLIDGTPIDRHYASVVDVAGGHPKLSSCLDADRITVYDRQADTYRDTHPQYLELYPDSAPVDYHVKDITDPEFRPVAELAVFCHVLEHLTLEDAAELVKRVDTDYALIYGPNVRAARDEDWFHYKPKDHRTFLTLEAMAKIMWYGGYTVTCSQEYHQDYIMFGERR